AVSWREGEGLRLHRVGGASGTELTIPLDVRAAILHVTELWLRLKAGSGSAELAVGVSGTAALGLAQLTVQRVGVVAEAGPNGGLRFRPPDGAGLTLDAGAIAGGGYLAYDESRYQYSGALQLEFQTIAL